MAGGDTGVMFLRGKRMGDALTDFGVVGMTQTPPVVDAATASRSSVPASFAVPAGAVVASAKVVVRAAPPGWTPVAQVAEVRPDVNGCVVIDFARMRTVRGIRFDAEAADATVTIVQPWLGSQFPPVKTGDDSNVQLDAEEDARFDFSELNTERLLVQTDADADAVAAHAQVMLSSAPAELELLIAGQRAWYQAGEAKRARLGLDGQGVTVTAADYFVTIVDVTAAVAAAAGRGPVPVELRATTPGVLGVELRLSFQRVYAVEFPEGDERVATLADEGPATVLLPLPAEASTWTLYGLAFTAAAKLGPTRVFPSSGPTRSARFEAVLDGEHAIALQVPASQLQRFGTLTAVRTAVYVEPGGAELGGALLADDDGAPGGPLPGGELTPIQLEPVARASGTPRWVTLATARPVATPSGAPIWVSLQVARGTVIYPLVDNGGPIRRGLPGGPWREFVKTTSYDLRAAVRIAGAAIDGAPIAALALQIADREPVALTPTPDGASATIVLDPPLAATAAHVREGTSLVLRLDASAAAAYRFRDVQVLYRLPGDL